MIQKGIDTRLLAALTERRGHVTSHELVDLVWTRHGRIAPATARQIIRNAVVRLRVEGCVINSTRKQDTSGFHLVQGVGA